MKRKVFFFDFDDTLYSHTTKEVPSSTHIALKRLKSLGHMVIVATGRGKESIALISKELGFTPETVIVLNGQVVVQDGKIVYENRITLTSMDAIIRKAKINDYAYGGYRGEGIVVNKYNSRVSAVWEDFLTPPPLLCPEMEQYHNLYQGHLYITEAEAQYFEPELDDYLTNWSHEYLVNLIPKQAGKSQAIRWLIDNMKLRVEDTYAFGDGFNDCDMLLAVGHGVAMGNATEQLKGFAEYVTSHIDNDGIMEALNYYNILESLQKFE